MAITIISGLICLILSQVFLKDQKVKANAGKVIAITILVYIFIKLIFK